MIEAYQIFEDEASRETGLPLWLTRSVDPEISFIVEERIDKAKAELDDYDEKMAKPDRNGKPKKKTPGLVRFVVPYDADGVPLEYGGITRQQFREAAIQEEQDRADGIDIDRVRPEGGYDPSEYGDGVTDLP